MAVSLKTALYHQHGGERPLLRKSVKRQLILRYAKLRNARLLLVASAAIIGGVERSPMDQNPIAERIRAERCRGGYTQEELAGRLGVTKAAVSKWECGQSAPDIALLPKLASLFAITLDELLGYEPLASVEKREEVQANMQSLLESDATRALDYANEQTALYWSDSELLRMIAMLLYAKAVELGNGAPEVVPGLADAVERLLERSLQLDPDGPSADMDLQTICMLMAASGREERAAELIEKKVAAKPDMVAVTFAGIKLRAGDAEEAARVLKRQMLFSLLEAASCAQALAGFPDLGAEDMEQLLAFAEGVQKPQGFAVLSPTLIPFIRCELAAQLAQSGQTDAALGQLEAFELDLEKCRALLAHPVNPPFFESVQEYLWENGDEAINTARGEMADGLCEAFAKRLETDERWNVLCENPRFKTLVERFADKGETL
ncbi:helix-turn-helix domain-containing protein [Adlercreutzia shanghongiae]|uniref:Helix-turn-helix transcriptional regulator n=1 Tax=Adlercreutzia shanghongiae TaxID=3111773 RepID=A0ABU6IWF5_9ACTN|nr:helix-turn-helix transcriptional regulator [Adlercreutzia sp. R22]MEC4293962.1 helix-turn-helix transcriptional regulator [Adlercreutzia sp. R22]